MSVEIAYVQKPRDSSIIATAFIWMVIFLENLW